MTNGQSGQSGETPPGGALVEIHAPPEYLVVTPMALAERKGQIRLLQEMVTDILREDVDYGHIKGIPGKMLFDPGAALIISAFKCHTGPRRILNMEDDGKRITVCLEVELMTYDGQVVGTGVGAASTEEIKYKYRWPEHPAELGYSEEEIKQMKTRRREVDGVMVTQYQIPNPEHGELLNTILSMASKRAEVDAAKALPGVGSALRLLFDGKIKRQPPMRDGTAGAGQSQETVIDDKPPTKISPWRQFWGEAQRLGFDQARVYQLLGVDHAKTWVDTGRTMQEALEIMRTGQKYAEAYRKAWDAMSMTPTTFAKESGYASMREMHQAGEKPDDCYARVAAVMIPDEIVSQAGPDENT